MTYIDEHLTLEKKTSSQNIFDKIASTYDTLNHALTLGIDIYWRKQFLNKLDTKNIENILDIATGTGEIPILLTKNNKNISVTGMDFSKQMLKMAISKVKHKKRSNRIKFIHGDAHDIPIVDNSFDATTIAFGLRNFHSIDKALSEMVRVTKSGGVVLILELSMPSSKIIHKIFAIYFRYMLPLIGSIYSKHKTAYKYLNESVEHFYRPCQVRRLMEKSGLKNCKATVLTFGMATIYIGDCP